MPHMNVLDLSVFPCMSKRHCALARRVGGCKVLSEDEIWSAAERVWDGLESAKVASHLLFTARQFCARRTS